VSLSDKAKKFLTSALESQFSEATDYSETRQGLKEWCEAIDEVAAYCELPHLGSKMTEVGLAWWDSRCPDCGASYTVRGHQDCPFPGGDPS
jgi:hypothetical protein